MKGKALVLSLLWALLDLHAQSDSLKDWKFSGIQVDLGTPMYTKETKLSQADYQKFIKNDLYLYQDFSAFQSSPFFYYRTGGIFPVPGLRLNYAKTKSKLNLETFLGIRYTQSISGGLYFSNTNTLIASTYTDQGNQTEWKNCRINRRV